MSLNPSTQLWLLNSVTFMYHCIMCKYQYHMKVISDPLLELIIN